MIESLLVSGLCVVGFLLLFGIGLQQIIKRSERARPVPVVAFRIPLPLSEVNARLEAVTQEPEAIGKREGEALVNFSRGREASLLFYPAVIEGGAYQRLIQTARFNGAVLLWEEAQGDTTALFIAEPMPDGQAIRSALLWAARNQARGLMEKFRQLASLPSSEEAAGSAERLHARLQESPWELRRQLQAIERMLVLRAFPLNRRIASRGLLAGGAAAFSVLVFATILTDRQTAQDAAIIILPAMALFGTLIGTLFFAFVAATTLTHQAVRSPGRWMSSPGAIDADSDTPSIPNPPWWLIALMIATEIAATWIAITGDEAGVWGMALGALAPLLLATLSALLVTRPK